MALDVPHLSSLMIAVVIIAGAQSTTEGRLGLSQGCTVVDALSPSDPGGCERWECAPFVALAWGTKGAHSFGGASSVTHTSRGCSPYWAPGSPGRSCSRSVGKSEAPLLPLLMVERLVAARSGRNGKPSAKRGARMPVLHDHQGFPTPPQRRSTASAINSAALTNEVPPLLDTTTTRCPSVRCHASVRYS